MTPTATSQRLLALERVCCCFCGSSEGRTWHSGTDVEFKTCANTFRFIRCPTCGHVYLAERPAPDDVPKIYEGYLTINHRSAYFPSRSVRWLKDRFIDRYRLRDVLRHLRDGSRVLDIGAGTGNLLRLVRVLSHKRLQLWANDYSFDERTQAELESDGIIVLTGPIEGCLTDGRFDAMTAVHVIEHVSDPNKAFEWIANHLKTGGVLYLETPDVDAFMGRLFGRHWGMLHFPRHFNLFTTAELARLAADHGLTVVRHRHTTGAPAWNMSLRNLLGLDALTQVSFADVFNYSNKATLGLFTLLDLALLLVGVATSTQQMVAVKRSSQWCAE